MAVPESLMTGNTPKIFGQGGPKQVQQPNTNIMLPAEKAMLRERRRVESLITGYRRNPSRYDEPYVMQLEQLAAQYDIPFERASAGVARNTGAAIGGFVDSFLWDLMPDSWYSSDATANARMAGKGVGLASAALLTGGTSLLGKGMTKLATTGIGKFTTAGAALGLKKYMAPAVAGYAKDPGFMGNVARTYAQSGQGKNVASMAVDDAVASATALAKGGDKGAALSAIEGTAALTDDATKVALAEKSGAVAKGVESQVYAASKGIGAAAEGTANLGKVETVLTNILNLDKGVGVKTRAAINNVLKDKNKMKQLEQIVADPNNSVDDVIDAIKAILPKSVRGKLVNKSDIVQQLATLYGFSGVGG